MGAWSLGQARPGLGLESWPLAAVKLADDVKEYSPRREIIAATGDVIKLQWEEFRAVAAACCVPAIVIVLVCGLVVGQPFATLAATAGAFSVGFGLCQRSLLSP